MAKIGEVAAGRLTMDRALQSVVSRAGAAAAALPAM